MINHKPKEIKRMEQGTEKWHQFRSLGIGASEANILAGKNRWNTVIDLWNTKTGRYVKPFVMNDAIQHGIDTEPEARQQFELATGIEMTPKCFVAEKHEYIRASLDGINNDHSIILEIKCPSSLSIHMKTVRGVVPDYYYPQLQHQLYVTQTQLACFWSYVQSMGGFMIEVEPNLPYIAELVHREKFFWECVTNDIEPKIDDFPEMNP
jgi:putative phage-type endonuclease